MNYKIKVGSEVESKEVQGLFFELGGCWATCGRSYNDMVELGDYVFLTDSSMLNYGLGIGKEEITIPQLKDMVVLKRNMISDATHENTVKQKLLKVSSGWYIFNTLLDVWEWNGEYLGYQPTELKPITKEPVMKEFLNPDQGYKLVCCAIGETLIPENWIEIPDGVDIAFQTSSSSPVVFKRSECGYSNAVIVWQRETLNDKVASAEVARQEFIGAPFSDLPESDFEAVDDFVESNVEQGVKHPHYKKDISHLDTLDIYRVTELFNPYACGAHIAKKALCSGQRGHKDLLTDIQDIIDTAERWKEMLIEDEKAK